MGLLNDLGFAITEDDLLADDEQTQTGITVEYDPANLAAALTVAAAVPGAILLPTDGLGTQVRLLLGESYDGTVQAVSAGVVVTGSVADPSTDSAAPESSAATLSAGDIPAINAGEQLCA